MTRRAPIDESLGSEFSRREALAAGIPVGRLAANDLRIVFRGARVRAGEPPAPDGGFEAQRAALIARCAAYVPVAPSQFAFSHATAAALHGIPLPPRLRAIRDLHVVVPPGVRAPRRDGIVGHTSRMLAPVTRAGFPVVEPALAWLQLAPDLTVDELVVGGDALVRRKMPLATLAAIDGLIQLNAGMRGISRARQARLDIRPGTDSPPESSVRLRLVRGGLPEPVIRHTVYDSDGFFVGTPDLAYVEERIAIEYQGAHHWEDREVFEEDIIRRELFRRAGWHVLLVTSRSLRHPAHLVAEVGALLLERSPRH